MSLVYIVATAIAVALTGYLCVALLKPEWFEGKTRVGLTAGASAPEVLVREVIERVRALGAVSVRKMDGIEETIKFPLPKGLKLDDIPPPGHIS